MEYTRKNRWKNQFNTQGKDRWELILIDGKYYTQEQAFNVSGYTKDTKDVLDLSKLHFAAKSNMEYELGDFTKLLSEAVDINADYFIRKVSNLNSVISIRDDNNINYYLMFIHEKQNFCYEDELDYYDDAIVTISYFFITLANNTSILISLNNGLVTYAYEDSNITYEEYLNK